MREIKRQFYMRWDEMLMVLVVEAGFFLFGEVLLAIVVYGAGEKESVIPLGTILALSIPIFVMLFVGMSSLPLYFNLAIGLGAVRRRTVPAILGMSLFINITAAWTACLFYQLEQWILRVVYAGIENECDLQFVFQWKYILPACLAVAAFNAFMGALFLKYGKVVFTVFWILWMIVFVGGPRIWHLAENTQGNAFLRGFRKVVELFLGFSERGILTAVVLLSAGVIFVAWLMLCRQQVDA